MMSDPKPATKREVREAIRELTVEERAALVRALARHVVAVVQEDRRREEIRRFET